MAISFRHLIVTTGMLLIAPWLAAQTPPGAALPIKLNFTAYAISTPSKPVLFTAKSDALSTPVKFYSSARSEVYHYTGTNPVIFFDEKPSPVPGEPPAREAMAKVTVPENITKPLFIFFPNPSAPGKAGELPYLVYVFDDSSANLPPGHVRFINVSGLDFMGKINERIQPIKAGLTDPISVGRSAHVELRTQFKERYYQSYLSAHTLAASERALMLLLPPLNPGSIEVQVRILKGQPDDDPKIASNQN